MTLRLEKSPFEIGETQYYILNNKICKPEFVHMFSRSQLCYCTCSKLPVGMCQYSFRIEGILERLMFEYLLELNSWLIRNSNFWA